MHLKIDFKVRQCAALASLLAVPLLNAQLPGVGIQESATEIIVTADFTGNGLIDTVLVDRASGAWRIGAQNVSGTLTWSPAYAGGIGDVSAATAGRVLQSTRHTLLLVGADANKLAMIDPTVPTNLPVVSYPSGSIGPSGVVTGRILGVGTHDDVIVASSLNNFPQPYRLRGYDNAPAGNLTLHSSPLNASSAIYDGLHRALLGPSAADWVSFMERSGGAACLRIFSMAETGMPVRLIVCGLTGETRFATAQFGGASIATLLTWEPGNASFSRHTISASGGGNYSAAAPVSVAAPFPLGAVVPVIGNGIVRLALLSADGFEVSVHDFDGSSLGPSIQQLFASSPMEPIRFVSPMAGAEGMLVLRGDPAGTGTGVSNAELFEWSAGLGSFALASSASFDPIAPRAGMANVTFMTAEPFVNADARPILLRNTRDWTSGAQPVLPGPVSSVAETWLGESSGLGSAQVVGLGAAPAGTNYVLFNQYADPISIFTLSRAEGAVIGQVGIDPQPGTYDKSIELRFASLPAGLTIYFRDLGGSWQLYAEPGPEPAIGDPGYAAWFSTFASLVRYQATTIEYYGVSGNRRTPIRRASYTFTEPPDTLSSLGDGVPDYVKLGLGHNPFSSPEGDPSSGALNWRQALLDGSGVDNRRLSGAAVDVYVRPLSDDGMGDALTPSRLATNPPEVLPNGTVFGGNQIFAFDLGGGELGKGSDPLPATTDRNEGLGNYPAFADPSAYLTTLTAGPGAVHVLASRNNFALAGNLVASPSLSSVGRELVGILPIAEVSQPEYSRSLTGGSLAAEAAAWVSGATSFFNAAPPPEVSSSLSAADAVALLLFEQWLQQRMVDRGLLSGDYAIPVPSVSSPSVWNPNYLSLTGFRAREGASPMASSTEGPVTASAAALRSLAQWQEAFPAYRLAEVAEVIRDYVLTSADAGAAALRQLATDVYRISATHGEANPGALEPPLDVLREFLATGALPEIYTSDFVDLPGSPFTALAATAYENAINGMAAARSLPAGRPTVQMSVEFRADSFDTPGCLLVNELFVPGVVYSLFNRDGRPFRLPSSFSVLPGTRMELRAFTDLPSGSCTATALEVIELEEGQPLVEVLLLPTANGSDSDGNLLGDEWELAFFGQLGNDPWLDASNDGYTTLQKYLDGKDPFMPASYGGGSPVVLEIPELFIDSSVPGQVTISFTFPDEYIDQLSVGIYEDPTLSGDWSLAPYPLSNPQPNQYQFVVPFGTSAEFWQVGISLP